MFSNNVCEQKREHYPVTLRKLSIVTVSLMSQNPEARHWIVVINNPTELDRAQVLTLREHLDYSIFAEEIGEGGTPHLQGYICFKKKKKFTVVKKMLPRANLQVKNGTVAQAIAYCKKGTQPKEEWSQLKEAGPNYGKDAEYVEWGEVPEEQTAKGHKESLARYQDTVTKAKEDRLDEISADHLLKYYKTIKSIREDTKNKVLPKDLEWSRQLGNTPNLWIYGPTGTGKSTLARRSVIGSWYYKMNNKWWQDYNGEETVIIEDIGRTHEWMGDFLKIWGDKYAFRAECKYGSVVLRPQVIIVTSNYHPKDLWPDENVYLPLLERFKLIYKQKLEAFDTSVSKLRTQVTKKRKIAPPTKPLFRQNAYGNLEKYKDTQPVIVSSLKKASDMIPNTSPEIEDQLPEVIDIVSTSSSFEDSWNPTSGSEDC